MMEMPDGELKNENKPTGQDVEDAVHISSSEPETVSCGKYIGTISALVAGACRYHSPSLTE